MSKKLEKTILEICLYKPTLKVVKTYVTLPKSLPKFGVAHAQYYQRMRVSISYAHWARRPHNRSNIVLCKGEFENIFFCST